LLSGIPWLEHGFGTRLDAVSQDAMASLRQIHSAIVLVADRAGLVGEGDALVTNLPGMPVSVRTADCYPILFVDLKNRAVAAVHAGWRGTAAQIAPAVLRVMRESFGTQPADIHAAIGPGIGLCCYEVGSEVAQQFGMPRAGCIDLAGANRNQLLAAGVPAAGIEITGGCTRCDPRLFHSFRRDRERAGRMISFASVTGTR
jgi:purine-nucleoside/S-methyl-5'-thioadenosine phosphorylase / adenosine deaminase